MHTPAHLSQKDRDKKISSPEPAMENADRPSEMASNRSEDGGGGSYEKEGTQPPKGHEMPEFDESTAEGEARNERISIVHDPKKDNQGLDAFTDRVNERHPAEQDPDNATAPKR